LNDICYQYISIILCKFCESSYYKQTIFRNTKLINKLITKFLYSENLQLIKFLLEIIHNLSEEDSNICKTLHEKNVMKILIKYIRYYDNHSKIFAINLLVNIYSLLNLNFDTESMFSWSITILFNILKDESATKIKLKIINIITSIIKKSVNLQNTFYNLSCLDNVLKEFRSCFSEDKIKEMEDAVKNWKSKKEIKKHEGNNKENCKKTLYNLYNLVTIIDEANEYKKSLIDCLVVAASDKDELRKKIIESKEIILIINLLLSYEELNSKIVLSNANLIFSLSRANIMFKKVLQEYEISDLLFKISNHSNLEIQISATSSLCNFLLDLKKVLL